LYEKGKRFRLIKFQDGAIVIQKKENKSWETDFTISPLSDNICPKCGHPLLKNQSCKFHSELKSISSAFSLCYGGYYQTDLNFKPLNEYSRRIQNFKNNSNYIEIFYKILKYRWNNSKDEIDYSWMTLVPTRNKNMEILTEIIASKLNLNYLHWENVFKYFPIGSVKYERNKKKRKNLVTNKYKLNLDNINKTKIDLSLPGVIMDDIFNTGMTMSYIINLISKKTIPTKIKGLVLARTLGKQIRYIQFPKTKRKTNIN